MKKHINILIVNYNTQKLTTACIQSINKHTPNTNIFVFDNSDKEPFVNNFDNVRVIDNTNGGIINFDEVLSKYTEKTEYAGKSGYGSAKHTMSIDKCFDIINDNFILLDSDVLVKKDISVFYDENYVYAGIISRTDKVSLPRLLPFICFLNVKLLKKKGIRYFSGNQICGLTKDSDKYDTGASLVIDTKDFLYKEINIYNYVEHYACGSWHNLPGFSGRKVSEDEWLNAHKSLWKDSSDKLDIFICTHKDFKKQVNNEVYKVIDSREIKEKVYGLDDKEMSELYQHIYIAENYDLKDYVGFCHYRRYFSFMDNIPDVDEIFKDYDAIIGGVKTYKKSVREYYGIWHNIDDLNILSDIIKNKYPDYYKAYESYMNNNTMFACNMFIMKKDDFLECARLLKSVLKDLVEVIGLDVDKRIEKNKDKYLKKFSPNDTAEYQHRIYGYLLERLVGVYIVKHFRKLKAYKILITEQKYNNENGKTLQKK